MKEFWQLTNPLPNEENDKVINEYLLLLKNEQRTKRKILKIRNTFQEFFHVHNVSLSAITMEDVEEWITEKKKACTRRTILQYLSFFRTFFRYCLAEGLIEKQPIHYMYEKINGDDDWKLKTTLPNAENEQMINDYLFKLHTEQWTKLTIKRYRTILQSFFKETTKPFSAISFADVERWMAKNKIDRHTTSHLSTFRSFFNYCVDKGKMEIQPIPYKWKEGNSGSYWKLKTQLPNKESHREINDFLMSLKVSNYSKHTILAYRNFLQKFSKDRSEISSSLTSSQIQQWFIQHEKGFQEATIKNHLIILSSFYNFCVEEEIIDRSPIKTRMFPRPRKAIPKYLAKEEVAKVREKTDHLWLRNRCIFEFLYSSGCRIDEVYRLNRVDVDLENRIAMVLGKGKKYRQVHFSEKCANLLEIYVEGRLDANPALFVTSNQKANRLSKDMMRLVLKQLGEDAGITGSLHPHRLRHTYATEMLAKGADLLFIADELGHTDVQTTQIYANLPKQELISLYRKYMG
ncbi:tyrosine-type recombinase/integrase [Sporosarcina aquimarina]|uniref:tyrosine-type recombinase/integrase n=1 Tax=Sporosarcina aquimarina TaxID=114975 RepID=UPI001C8E4B85|nr:tyrosine-type recombinase/integrase [Sporosarcina aquimarina]MBY0221666.1 tyrosine-type recombinase/integrase [Sporosarcina aquimarina]